MAKKNATPKREPSGMKWRAHLSREGDNYTGTVADNWRGIDPLFPPELTTRLMHESGFFGAIMLPIDNLAAFAGHPNPHICAAGLWAANARSYLNSEAGYGYLRCSSCDESIRKASRIVALILLKGLNVNAEGAVCRDCGPTDAALAQGLQRLADAHASNSVKYFDEVTGRVPMPDYRITTFEFVK